MFIHFDGSASFSGRGTAARRRLGSANCANPCMHCRRNPSPSGSGICANCPTPFCLRNTGPYSGTKEFPVAAARAGALLFRIAGMEGRSGDRRSAKPVAGIAEIGISPKGCAPSADWQIACANCGNSPAGDNAGAVIKTSRITLGSVIRREMAGLPRLNPCKTTIKGPGAGLFHVACGAK